MSEDSRYADSLAQEGRNLTALATRRGLPLPQFREQEVAKVIGALARGRSVMLVGETGAGKSTVLHGVAASLQASKRELWEMATTSILTNTRYLGEWPTKARAVLKTLRKRNGIWFVPDVWNVLSVGTSENDPTCLFDVLRTPMTSGELQLVAEVTPHRLQMLQATPALSSLFEVVPLDPLARESIAAIVAARANSLGIAIDGAAIHALLELCRKFLPNDHGPGRALRLIAEIDDYRRQKAAINEPEEVDARFIEKVFSIYSGLPRFVVSRDERKSPQEMRAWFRSRVIGQQQAVDAIVEVLTLFKAGLNDPGRPIGSLLFVGPTGVGKTELAKATARFLFGSEARLLRFDLSEFKDYHSFELLVGDPEKPHVPARLLDPVRLQPFQVILFDEIEKAHGNVWDMLLQLLDEGHVSPPSGARADFRNTIVIATSNVGSEDALRRPIGFVGEAGNGVPIKSLEAVFRPELLNRFQHIVPFAHLALESVREITRREVARLLERDGIASRNLAVDVGEDLLDAVIEAGYSREYGARALKREVQRAVLYPIAQLLADTDVPPGSIVRLSVAGDAPAGQRQTRVRILETEASRAHRRAVQRVAGSAMPGRQELKSRLESLNARMSRLQRDCDRPGLAQRLAAADLQLRTGGARDAGVAQALLVEIDGIRQVLARLDSIDESLTGLVERLSRSPLPDWLAKEVAQATQRLEAAERELVHMPDEGIADILVAIIPVGAAATLRELLANLYMRWAGWRGHGVRILGEPDDAAAPLFLGITGPYAFGYLRGECGVHRLRNQQEHEVVKVEVAAWSHAVAEVAFGMQRAVKQQGQPGRKVRSEIEVLARHRFRLRNELTINENRDLAPEIAASWDRSLSSDTIVRRYDVEPFLLKDHLTGLATGRRASLEPAEFHELLCRRFEAHAPAGE